MKRFQSVKGMFILIMMLMLCIGYFYHISNREKEPVQENVETSKSQKAVSNVLLRDLEHSYPSTPKEVLKYYAELTQVLYSEEYTEAQLLALSSKIQELYDEELVANQEPDIYMENLRAEIAQFHNNGWTISSFSTSASTDVERFSQDGYDFARLYCTFNIFHSGGYESTQEVFLLRKDADGHWKIYGWKLAED